jgi:hypothetical protein
MALLAAFSFWQTVTEIENVLGRVSLQRILWAVALEKTFDSNHSGASDEVRILMPIVAFASLCCFQNR